MLKNIMTESPQSVRALGAKSYMDLVKTPSPERPIYSKNKTLTPPKFPPKVLPKKVFAQDFRDFEKIKIDYFAKEPIPIDLMEYYKSG